MNLILYIKSHRPEDGEMRLLLNEQLQTYDNWRVAVACEIIKLQKTPGLIQYRRWEIEDYGQRSEDHKVIMGRPSHVFRLLKTTLVNNYTNSGDILNSQIDADMKRIGIGGAGAPGGGKP